MPDRYPPAVQKPALIALAAALGSADNALCRDQCGDWRLSGSRGHVYAVPGGFQFFVMGCETKQAWTFAKRALAFAKVCNDGDTEGGFILDRLPTPAEAEAIRHYAGIRKRPDLTPEQVVARRSLGERLAIYRPSAPARLHA